jgi:hypothetical protein
MTGASVAGIFQAETVVYVDLNRYCTMDLDRHS